MNNMSNTFTSNQSMAMGVYTPSTQFVLSQAKLHDLGFSPYEVQQLTYILSNENNVSVNRLTRMGINYEYAKRLKYLNDIATGKATIQSKQDFQRHLRKLYGKHKRICLNDFIVSKIRTVPRFALIGNITDPTYKVLNSTNYKPNKQYLFPTTAVTPSKITISFPYNIAIKYGYPKKVPNVLEIKGKKDGKTIVEVDKKYAKLTNRYIIVASLRRPEFYLGMTEIICIEGTMVYVFAKDMGTAANVNYQGGTLRVYDYGYNPAEIKQRVIRVASNLYTSICGTYAEYIDGNCDFRLVSVPVDQIKAHEETEEIVIEE